MTTTYRGYEMPKPTGFGAINDGRFGYFYNELSWQQAVDESIENDAFRRGDYEPVFFNPVMCTRCGASIVDTQIHDAWHDKGD